MSILSSIIFMIAKSTRSGVSQQTQLAVALSVSLKLKWIRSTMLRLNHLVACASRNV